MNECPAADALVPDWVPVEAYRYLAHTVAGQSIRNLARAAGVHASTVLRQVHRIETRRDDPLVDLALTALAMTCFAPAPGCGAGGNKKEPDAMTQGDDQIENLPDCATMARESCRILRRLCETGAVLAVAEQMEKAVVVRDDGPGGAGARTAVVARAIAQAMALQDWISCSSPGSAPGSASGRVSRYRITAAGRAALTQMLAESENRATSQREGGFGEAPTGYFAGSAGPARSRRSRYNAAESPLCALARRRDRDGKPFLSADLVQAGERLREDFELAQMGPRVTRNWEHFLTSSAGGGSGAGDPEVSAMARERMARALGDLGQGLGDVALRCCCYLEGLEVAEKRMGWSARSGKIVLRIALQRLRQHYASLSAPDQMIG